MDGVGDRQAVGRVEVERGGRLRAEFLETLFSMGFGTLLTVDESNQKPILMCLFV